MKTVSKWVIFILVAFAQFMVVVDVAITNVGISTIEHEVHFAGNSLQWVVTAYTLCFGGFLLLGGRLADLYGRRTMLLLGTGGFVTASLLIGLSQSPEQLIAMRGVQGLAAAFMSPAALSIVLVTFREADERGRALGYWALVSSAGAAVGMLLGGMLTEYFGWQWDFFINVPIGLITIFFIYRFVPVHESEEKKAALDMLGAILVTTSLSLLVLAVTQGENWGWTDAKIIGTGVASVLIMIAFLINELKTARPLVPLSIFKLPNITVANAMMMLVYATLLGNFFLTSLYLQTVLNFSPLLCGLAFLPIPLVLGFLAARVPRLVQYFGFRRFMITGPLIVALGLVGMVSATAESSYWFHLLPTFIVTAIGLGLSLMPIMSAATSAVAPQQSGLASGLMSTSQQIGGAVGVALLAAIATATTASQGIPSSPESLASGYQAAYIADIGFMLLASSLAALFIRSTPAR